MSESPWLGARSTHDSNESDRGRAFAVHANSAPTLTAYAEWQSAFAFFNARLFGNALPECLITYARRSSAFGYFCAGAFVDRDGALAHEISMNPSWFEARGDAASYSTLVHEMCHLWRHIHGRANRKGGRGAAGYHDLVWADQMEAVGLVASNTGAPGGRRTGYQMTHYTVAGGPFDLACRELLIAGQGVNWRDARRSHGSLDDPQVSAGVATPPKNTRTRFVCAGCDLKAWSRASARLSCADCDQPLLAK